MTTAMCVSVSDQSESFVSASDGQHLRSLFNSIGVAAKPGMVPGELVFASSRLDRVVAGLSKLMDVELVCERQVSLSCSTACLSAKEHGNECRCRCSGAFHAAQYAPEGVSVDDDAGAYEFDVRVKLMFAQGEVADSDVVRYRIHSALHEQAVELASVLS